MLGSAGEKQVDGGCVAAMSGDVQGRGAVGVGLGECGRAARAGGACSEDMQDV